MVYSIRPTERGKGYGKIYLYLGLQVLKQYGIEKAFLDAAEDNPASWKTMESLGGVNVRTYFDDEYAHRVMKDYDFDVEKSLADYHDEYGKYIADEDDKKTK